MKLSELEMLKVDGQSHAVRLGQDSNVSGDIIHLKCMCKSFGK